MYGYTNAVCTSDWWAENQSMSCFSASSKKSRGGGLAVSVVANDLL